ncbi:hypothetical protein K503DRAFT_699419 [Rhizopogon vinicolor AM-OR11-026]|uniref:Chromo domain-containing protein n=1 Tax=Rhizopogon vinicolor AM-OR11-026 TaxID=1314800 RepID=A0A1B7MN65_9AGAM|nr:hypothetical protein K503DRAFT_699419 [Rhizopogon vinicolor AM-OR11-026]
MGLNSASAVGAGSTRLSEKRIRPISRKARESTGSTQKVRQPRKNTSGTSNKRPPQKRKSKSLSAQNEALMCQWPAKSEQDGSFQRQFVQCDNCDLWYHFECVGIVEEDLRLDPEASFICPPCWYTLRNRDEKCARPDCLHAHVDEQEYMIERLVGRKPVGEAGYLFLVKWEGYPIAQATWIPEGNMGDATQTVVRFAADARAEGIDLGTKGAILLEEAKVGGWDV